jgi:exonuclease SbcD
MDFGEEHDRKAVLVVDAAPGSPAKVREVPLSSGRAFRTVRGSMAQLADIAASDAWGRADETGQGRLGVDAGTPSGERPFIRVLVREKARVGLADEARELFPDAVEVKIEAPEGSAASRDGAEGRTDRSPHDLFTAYLTERGVEDERLVRLFDELLDEVTQPDAEAEVTGDAA